MKIIQLRDEDQTTIDLNAVSMIRGKLRFYANICVYSFEIVVGFDKIGVEYHLPYLLDFNGNLTQSDYSKGEEIYSIYEKDYQRICDFLLDKRKNDFLERIEDLEEKVDHLLYILDKGEIRLTKNQKKNIAAGIEVLDEAIKEIKVKKGK